MDSNTAIPKKSRNYLLTLSVDRSSAETAKRVLANINANVDQSARPLWIDPHGIAIFISSNLVALEIWKEALTGMTNSGDLLIVEIGSDWMARKESKPEHWLTTHVGHPKLPLTRPR